jgi:hypothetical protein
VWQQDPPDNGRESVHPDLGEQCDVELQHVFSTMEIDGPEHHNWRLLQQAIEYSGITILTKMANGEGNRILNMLGEHHPKVDVNTPSTLPVHGTKTVERLRGNTRLGEWMSTASNFEDWAPQRNAYHNMGDVNMHDDEDAANAVGWGNSWNR